MYDAKHFISVTYMIPKSLSTLPLHINKLTKYFHFTEFIEGISRVSIRIGNVCQSLVVVDDILSMYRTGSVKNGRYGAVGKVCVLETECPVILVCCVRYIQGKT